MNCPCFYANNTETKLAVVAEWSKSPCFKFKLRKMFRSQVLIPFQACLYGTVMDPLYTADGIWYQLLRVRNNLLLYYSYRSIQRVTIL